MEDQGQVKADHEIHGAKILIPGNDKTVQNFLREYVRICIKDLQPLKNNILEKNVQIYMLPFSQNSISQYLAAREPLYR